MHTAYSYVANHIAGEGDTIKSKCSTYFKEILVLWEYIKRKLPLKTGPEEQDREIYSLVNHKRS